MLILLYHGITEQNPPKEIYSVNKEEFKKQMLYLKENKYNILSLGRLAEILKRKEDIPEKSVIITFDDGLLSQFEYAYPLLKELNLSACFFITASKVNQTNYMNWVQIRILIQNNMEIGSHGLTHQILYGENDKVIVNELKTSKEILEKNLKIPIDYLSIPRGWPFREKKIIHLSKEVGYNLVCSSKIGYINLNSDIFTLPRIPLKRNIAFSEFIQILKESSLKLFFYKIEESFKNNLKIVLGIKNYEYIRKKLLRKEYTNEHLFPGE